MPSAQKSGPEPKTQIRFSRFEGLRRLAAEELLHLFNEAGASRGMLVLTPFRQRRTEFLQEVLLLRGEVHRRFHVQRDKRHFAGFVPASFFGLKIRCFIASWKTGTAIVPCVSRG